MIHRCTYHLLEDERANDSPADDNDDDDDDDDDDNDNVDDDCRLHADQDHVRNHRRPRRLLADRAGVHHEDTNREVDCCPNVDQNRVSNHGRPRRLLADISDHNHSIISGMYIWNDNTEAAKKIKATAKRFYAAHPSTQTCQASIKNATHWKKCKECKLLSHCR